MMILQDNAADTIRGLPLNAALRFEYSMSLEIWNSRIEK